MKITTHRYGRRAITERVVSGRFDMLKVSKRVDEATRVLEVVKDDRYAYPARQPRSDCARVTDTVARRAGSGTKQ